MDREAAAFNGDIVSDMDSDNAEEYAGIDTVHCETARALIVKRRKVIRRRARYTKSKTIAEQTFLGRKTSSSVRGIVKDFPEIGKTIEEFVQERNIGADHWRRTGVLTFDGNTSVQQ